MDTAIDQPKSWRNAICLAEFKALSFDCYRTLIDWESGMIAALKPLTDRARKKLSSNDNEILEAHATTRIDSRILSARSSISSATTGS
jgi:hypothetical protein